MTTNVPAPTYPPLPTRRRLSGIPDLATHSALELGCYRLQAHTQHTNRHAVHDAKTNHTCGPSEVLSGVQSCPNLDIGLIDPPRQSSASLPSIQPSLLLRHVSKDPPREGCVSHINVSLRHQCDQIAIANLELLMILMF